MKYIGILSFIAVLLFWRCDHTVGTIEIKGKVLDDHTKVSIPSRKVIIQALLKNDQNQISVDAGQFTTDSTGRFNYTLQKIRNANLYNFYCVGDSAYASSTILLGLTDLNRDGKFLKLFIRKLTDFTITIFRKSKVPACDTLYVIWKSNDLEGSYLYPYEIENFGEKQNIAFRWIGGDVKAKIKTKVFADKNTLIYFELARNRKRREFVDTVFCRRDMANSANFKY